MERIMTIMWRDEPQVRIKWDTRKYGSATAEVFSRRLEHSYPKNTSCP